MKWVIWILFVLLLSSCCISRDCKVSKASRKIETLSFRYPELKVRDTVLINHEVVVPQVNYDSSFITQPIDTIFIKKDKLRIKIVRQRDTILVNGTCKADTIYSTIKLPYEKVVVKPSKVWSNRCVFIVLILIFLILQIRKVF